MTPDKRDVALVADAAEINRKEAERKQRRMAREARLRAHAHDVLAPFKCSLVAHCPMQATQSLSWPWRGSTSTTSQGEY